MQRTTYHYAPPTAIRGDLLVFPDDEAHHVARVLRQQPGDELVVVDGEGGWYHVRLEHVDRRQVVGRIVEVRRDVGEPSYFLSIGMALLKNRSRFETFLEKAVEFGVGQVMPLITERTEREHFKETRAHNILVAAMKQSQRSRLVELAEPVAFGAGLSESGYDLSLLCHEATDRDRHILDALAALPGSGRRVRIWIGPEGGFSDAEVAAAQAAGFEPVSLGPRRLRAESAALTAAAAVMLAHR